MQLQPPLRTFLLKSLLKEAEKLMEGQHKIPEHSKGKEYKKPKKTVKLSKKSKKIRKK